MDSCHVYGWVTWPPQLLLGAPERFRGLGKTFTDGARGRMTTPNHTKPTLQAAPPLVATKETVPSGNPLRVSGRY